MRPNSDWTFPTCWNGLLRTGNVVFESFSARKSRFVDSAMNSGCRLEMLDRVEERRDGRIEGGSKSIGGGGILT